MAVKLKCVASDGKYWKVGNEYVTEPYVTRDEDWFLVSDELWPRATEGSFGCKVSSIGGSAEVPGFPGVIFQVIK